MCLLCVCPYVCRLSVCPSVCRPVQEMGLCKCPKRKVTNLFCFEHRVNVCEHCLVSNHNKVGGRTHARTHARIL